MQLLSEALFLYFARTRARNKIQATREEEGGEGLARLEKQIAEIDACAVFY